MNDKGEMWCTYQGSDVLARVEVDGGLVMSSKSPCDHLHMKYTTKLRSNE